MILDVQQFIRKERPYWESLEKELQVVEAADYRARGPDAWWKLRQLVSRTAGDLVRVRTFAANPELEEYLEQLLARANVAMNPPGSTRMKGLQLIPMLLTGFPRAWRRHLSAFMVATLFFLVGSLAGAGLVHFDSEAKGILMPFSHLLLDPEERVAEEESGNRQLDADSKMSFSAQLMTHNIQVSFFVFATGFLFGVGTLYLLFYNGMILGAVAADFIVAGQGTFLMGWLLPHGSIEIPAILIAGQGGLVLGSRLLGIGGSGTIGQRIRSVRGDLMLLLGGVAMLLVWAGIVEAFLSQDHEPAIAYSVKILIGVAELVLLAAYLAWAGKGRNENGR